MINFADIAAQMNSARSITLSLQEFHRKTQISGQMIFTFNPEKNAMEIGLAFTPREPTKDEYAIFFDDLVDAERLLLNDYVLTVSEEVENLNQLVFKHKESTHKLIAKHQQK